MQKITYYILLTLLVQAGTYQEIFAQNKFTNNLNVMLNIHSGYNVPEYQMFTYITKDYIRSVDLSLMKETQGKDEWEQLYNYPEYGLSLFYSTLGNDNIFGRELSLNPFFRINIIYKKRFQLYSRISLGIGYVSKTFDIENNYLNVAVGSHINLHFNSRLGTSYKITDKAKLNLGISFDHFSNANTNEPNLGINYITGFIGVSYHIRKPIEKQKQEIKPHIIKNTFELIYNVGGKYSRALSSKKYFTNSLSFETKRNYFRAFSLGLGFDIFYDSSIKDQLITNQAIYKNTDNFQTGFHFSQTFIYDKISITIQEGIYVLFTENIENNVMYNRLILRYQLTDKFSIRLAMKSHLHILDYPEFGIGYKF